MNEQTTPSGPEAAPAATADAFSYLRFSTPEQSKGDSWRRQSELAKEYATKHGLNLRDDLTYEDLGVSAYRGRNAQTGALRAFLQAVEDEIIAQGSYLLVESLDRISREEILDAQAKFLEIVNAGITIVTLLDQRSYSRESIHANPTDLILSLLIMIRAREESATKAVRVAKKWQDKRAKAAEQPLTARGPAWLRLEGNRWTVIEDRAEIVRRVYEMTAAGHGAAKIAETLNREQAPTWQGVRRKGSTGPRRWHRSYVIKLLSDERPVGVFVPHSTEYEGPTKRRRRRAEGRVENYYPPVIERELWETVQALRASRSPGQGDTGRPIASILAGLCKCGRCGASMTRVAKGPTTKAGKVKLVCSAARVGAGCVYEAINVGDVEAVLVQGFERAAAEAPGPDEEWAQRWERIQNEVEDAEEDVRSLVEAITKSPESAALARTLRDAEADLARLEGEREETGRQALLADKRGWYKRVDAAVEAVRAYGAGEEADKALVNAKLRAAVSEIVVEFDEGSLGIGWHGDGASTIFWRWPRD